MPLKKPRKKSVRNLPGASRSEAVRSLVEATLANKNAQDIVAIDLKGKTDIADFMIVASGNSLRHVRALAGYVTEVLQRVGINPLQMEGQAQSEWIIIDNPLVVVHIFHPETREVYNLEKMWSAKFTLA